MRIATAAIGLLLCSAAAMAQPRKVDVPKSEQSVGSWLISCAMDPMTDAQVCRLRHKLWLVVPDDNHPGMALEVQLRGDQLLPVVTVRDLSLSTALSGLLALTATAQIRFDGAAMAELPCSLDGASVFCTPGKADAALLSEQLAKAKSVLVRFRAVGNLPLPVPDGPLALDLDHTQEALTRFRLAGPEVATAQTSLGQDLRDSAERLLRRLGMPGIEPQPGSK
jgi:invasion protein IalB